MVMVEVINSPPLIDSRIIARAKFNLNEVLALQLSIRKWYWIYRGLEKDRRGENCALCLIYNYCMAGCPVCNYMHKDECQGTPWPRWDRHIFWHSERHTEHCIPHPGEPKAVLTNWEGPFERKVHCAECRKLALQELEFLHRVLVWTITKGTQLQRYPEEYLTI